MTTVDWPDPPQREVMECSLDGCGSKAQVRGWCEKHYRRWLRHGDPTFVAERNPGDVTNRPGPIWDKESVTAALKRFAEETGRTPRVVDFRSSRPEWAPSDQTVYNLFGSFTAGVAAAGLDPMEMTMKARREGAPRAAIRTYGRLDSRVRVNLSREQTEALRALKGVAPMAEHIRRAVDLYLEAVA